MNQTIPWRCLIWEHCKVVCKENEDVSPFCESIDCQTEVSTNTLNKEGCKKSRLWLGTFILSQYIISSQISFALSIRGKGQNKHLTFAIFVLLLVHRAFLQCNINCLVKKLHDPFHEEIIGRMIE